MLICFSHAHTCMLATPATFISLRLLLACSVIWLSVARLHSRSYRDHVRALIASGRRADAQAQFKLVKACESHLDAKQRTALNMETMMDRIEEASLNPTVRCARDDMRCTCLYGCCVTFDVSMLSFLIARFLIKQSAPPHVSCCTCFLWFSLVHFVLTLALHRPSLSRTPTFSPAHSHPLAVGARPVARQARIAGRGARGQR